MNSYCCVGPKYEEIRVQYKGYYERMMSPDQLLRLRDYGTARFQKTTNLDGTVLKEARTSPVAVVGDSYVAYSTLIAPGTSMDELLTGEVNLRPTRVSVEGGSMAGFIELARDPELRAACKTVVWILTMRTVAQDGWALPAFLSR